MNTELLEILEDEFMDVMESGTTKEQRHLLDSVEGVDALSQSVTEIGLMMLHNKACRELMLEVLRREVAPRWADMMYSDRMREMEDMQVDWMRGMRE